MNLNIIYIYLLLINILTFVIFGIDKLKAIFNKHRIKEAKLFYLCFLGGSIGSLLAIYIFNHKTRKKYFTIGIPIILIIQIFIIIYLEKIIKV